MKIVEPYVKRLKFDNIYDSIEYATRNCYKSEKSDTPEKRDAFIYDKLEKKHFSVFEHSNIPLVWNFSKDEVDDAMYIYQWLQAVKGESNAKVYITLSALRQSIVMSGNVRGWLDLFSYNIRDSSLFNEGFLDMLETALSVEHPMFFLDRNTIPVGDIKVTTEDDAVIHSLDHATMSFEILTDRATTHQIVRHRAFSYAQESQRYCNYSKDKFDNNVNFVLNDIKVTEEMAEKIQTLSLRPMEIAEEAYMIMLENGIAPEVARMVLPNATATTLIMSGRLWDFYDFVDKRTTSGAQGPIKEIAKKIRKEIIEESKRERDRNG